MVDSAAPANVLGLSLLVRDELPLLRIDERVLGPGLSLRDYEADGLDLDPKASSSPTIAEFQHRRCHARQLTVDLDPAVLLDALASRWVGRTLAGATIEHVALDLDTVLGPVLRVRSRLSDGAWKIDLWVLTIAAAARRLLIRPVHHWTFGEAGDGGDLWCALGRAAGLDVEQGGIHIDPSRLVLTQTFVSAGWKAPDVTSLGVASLEIGARGCRIRLQRDAAFEARARPPALDEERWATVGTTLEAIQDGLRRGTEARRQALAQLDALTEVVAPLALARTAALGWLVDRLRHAESTIEGATARALGAVERWRDEDPEDPLARRWQIELLARLRRYTELARITDERLRSTRVEPEAQRLLDVALAELQTHKLGQAPPAPERLARWSRAGADDLGQAHVRLALARLEAGDPSRALATLDAVLPAIEDPEERFAERLHVALAMTEAKQYDAAAAQLSQLLREGTRDPHSRVELRTLASRLGEHAAALDDLRAELADASDEDRRARAGELARLGCAAGHPEALQWLAEALALDPDDLELLRWSARLHEQAGQLTPAIEALERLMQHSPSAGETRARLARLLLKRGEGPLDVVGTTPPLARPERAVAELEALLAADPQHDEALEHLAQLYEAHERWRDQVGLLERRFLRQHGAARCETLRKIAGLYRERLFDLPRAEQALRLALDHLGDDPSTRTLAEAMRMELVGDLRRQGRFVDLSIYLSRELEPEIEGRVAEADLHPGRLELLVELARIYRGPLDDEAKAVRIYERLEQCNRLPDEGLATLARAFRAAGRHNDLVRLLELRAKILAAQGERERKAAVDVRIAELLEGPLGRPHQAADHYLEAYLTDPIAHAAAGARARVLFAGVDAVANIRRKLLARLHECPLAYQPALLTLLGDVLGPHDEYEEEAEQRYREALAIMPNDGIASEALGRLLARQGRLDAAVGPLIAAATHPDLDPLRAAEDAAIAARALLELNQPDESEAVLKAALERAPDSQRALLELARLYERVGRPSEQAIVLEDLSELPLSSMLSAEVAYRRAMLLIPNARVDPFCPEAERARAYLLEAVSADSKHVAARHALLELARARLEWSVVAHMHYLAIRELPSGASRALVHLDLAETYLDHLGDVESATRNIESAITQAPADVTVSSRAGALAVRIPEPRKLAHRFERIAASAHDLEPTPRARLWLLAADLHLSQDDPASAEAAYEAVLALPDVPTDAAATASRSLELLAFDEARDLRQQKSGLLRLLESEDHTAERMHILRRLREIGVALDDRPLIEWASHEQLNLALDDTEFESDLAAATAALRDLYAERGDDQQIVELYRTLARRLKTDTGPAQALLEAARFTWHGLHDPTAAIELLRECLQRTPSWVPALQMLGEIARQCGDLSTRAQVYQGLLDLDPRHRPLALDLELGRLAHALGKETEAQALLRPLTVQAQDGAIRFEALRALDELLSTSSVGNERVIVLRRYLDECHERGLEEAGRVAFDLAQIELKSGNRDAARQSVHKGLSIAADHRGLLELDVTLLEAAEQWDALARALERLAFHVPDADMQARLFVRAARLRLDHSHAQADGVIRRRSVHEARRLLSRALEYAPHTRAALAELLPIAFSEGRYDEVHQLSAELRVHGHDDEEALILGALAEAYHYGQRSLARELGFRHDAAAHARFLYPGLRQVLTEAATRGPLPRLDAILAAASMLAGGRVRLSQGLRQWAAGRPIQAGLVLGLARLSEADGQADAARFLYQISAFMVPHGPVTGLVARLPFVTPPVDPAFTEARELVCAGPLQSLLLEHRTDVTATRRTPAPPARAPADALKTRASLASAILDPWRRHFGVPLPLAWSEAILPGGIDIGVDAEPTIFLSDEVGACALPEFRFRLAYAVAGIVLGHFLLLRTREGPRATLEALLQALQGRDVPSAPVWIVATQHRALRSRQRLEDELTHLLRHPGALERWLEQLERGRTLFACLLSGQLDGALTRLAHDRGYLLEGQPDPLTTLRCEHAHSLLRALGIY